MFDKFSGLILSYIVINSYIAICSWIKKDWPP